jgi:hypothetical protein
MRGEQSNCVTICVSVQNLDSIVVEHSHVASLRISAQYIGTKIHRVTIKIKLWASIVPGWQTIAW